MVSPAGHVAEMALVKTIVFGALGHTFDQVADRPSTPPLTPGWASDSLLITPSPSPLGGIGPYWYTDLDLGTPNIDDALTPFANASGAFDETQYFRERAISLSLVIRDNWFPTEYDTSDWDPAWNTSSFWVRELGRWVAPANRSQLYVRFSGEGAPLYRIDVRGAGMSQAIVLGDRTVRRVQLNFISASGLLRQIADGPGSTDPATTTVDGRQRAVSSYGGADGGQITMPITADGNGHLVDFPGSSVGSGADLVYTGTVPTGMIARVHSDTSVVHNPRLTFSSPGNVDQVVTLSGIDIPVGSYLEVNTETMSIQLFTPNSDGSVTATPAESFLVGPLRWPQLQPGHNSVKFTIASGTAPTGSPYVEVLYFPSFI